LPVVLPGAREAGMVRPRTRSEASSAIIMVEASRLAEIILIRSMAATETRSLRRKEEGARPGLDPGQGWGSKNVDRHDFIPRDGRSPATMCTPNARAADRCCGSEITATVYFPEVRQCLCHGSDRAWLSLGFPTTSRNAAIVARGRCSVIPIPGFIGIGSASRRRGLPCKWVTRL
jgi:hypothetical protein